MIKFYTLILLLILGYLIIRYYRIKKLQSEERAKRLYEQHQIELDRLYATINLQMNQLNARKMDLTITPENFNKHLLNPLSKRELEVIYLVVEGLSNQEIADKLFVSINTIKTHLFRIYNKLEVTNRTEAAVKATNLSVVNKQKT